MNLTKNQKGQMTVEAVLIIVLLVGLAAGVSSAFRSNEFVATLVSEPWRQLSGMIQNGNWGSPDATRSDHPSSLDRHSSMEGELVR